METNLRLYNKILQKVGQLLPVERVTRLRNMALLMSGLYQGRAVQMALVVRHWPSRSQIPSQVNRLRRFLNNPRVNIRTWYRPVAEQLLQVFANQPVRLVIDCTKVGFRFRMLSVSVAWRGRTLPLAWSIHRGDRGNVTVDAQLKMLRYVCSLMPRHRNVCLLGDSGFHSVALMQWLCQQGWHFVLRQQGSIRVSGDGKDWKKLSDFDVKPGETVEIGWVRVTRKNNFGWLWLVLHWQKGEEEPWYLLSDQGDTHTLLRQYRIRMWTEEMYGDMKRHGFDLESTHLDDEDRIARLVLGVCLTFVWLVALGSWVVKNGKRSVVDTKSRRDKSYFRIGWDWLARCLSLGDPFIFRFAPYP